MAKISAKNLDKNNRLRSKTVGFRVSPEEWALFELYVKISGLNKQDYLISLISKRDIIAQPNSRMYKSLRDNLKDVLVELKRLQSNQEPSKDLLETIQLLSTTLYGLKDEKKESLYQ